MYVCMYVYRCCLESADLDTAGNEVAVDAVQPVRKALPQPRQGGERERKREERQGDRASARP